MPSQIKIVLQSDKNSPIIFKINLLPLKKCQDLFLHMKFKSKIGYLGEKISILPWQMAEQLAVEVNVKI